MKITNTNPTNVYFKNRQPLDEDMQVMQYMSIHRGPLLLRLLQKMLRQESMIVLDLEATLSAIDQEKAQSLKAWGRRELTAFAHSHPDLFKNRKVGIRVNSLTSGELEYDLDAAHEISQIWNLHCIVAPMIDSPECLQEHRSLLHRKKVLYKTLIPIVETMKGVSNLSLIARHPDIAEVQYGHQDYCLDAGYWPFFEQNEVAFWDIVSSFIQKVEKAGLSYIHPPVSDISNEALFTQIYTRLQKLCRLPFRIITINHSQTALFNHLKNLPLESSENLLRTTSYSLQDKTDQALYIKKICSTKERNFCIDPMTKKFYSPHKYLAALRFLEEIDG